MNLISNLDQINQTKSLHHRLFESKLFLSFNQTCTVFSTPIWVKFGIKCSYTNRNTCNNYLIKFHNMIYVDSVCKTARRPRALPRVDLSPTCRPPLEARGGIISNATSPIRGSSRIVFSSGSHPHGNV